MINLQRFLTIICFLCLTQAYSHGDLDKRILAVTEEIKKSPDSAQLYFKRGKLYYQHDDYQLSIKDINYSIDLGYLDIEQELLLSKNYFELKDYTNALLFVDSILNKSPNDVVFLKIKAQTLFQDAQYEKSAIYFEKVIKYSSKTFPENYIDASEAWYLSPNDKAFDNSISILNQGIETLGQIISLLEKKVELYMAIDDFDMAIESQESIIKTLNRKEHAYSKLAELYMGNNDFEKAEEALNLSENSIKILPLRIQNTSNIKSLKEEIKQKKIQITDTITN
ncbi:tetratricopeptide repeat protein [Xanthomarina spongicola]|uniref:Tetratricopeptide repeat protein n=1 Tax=Xanthomarina spongicola TaxID=570520 RepID=A0A316DJS6_9FLAO|nr:hypothetical protein [Xanthomarina spongicola]PWK18487.1 tetratricopeptide repeat protein [Xanthomarina spongicola]